MVKNVFQDSRRDQKSSRAASSLLVDRMDLRKRPCFARSSRPAARCCRQEFASGIDPAGTPWPDTVRGKQALESKKLAGAFDASVVPGGAKFVGSVTRGWLTAVQEGHSFGARQVADKANVMRFNSRGRLIGKAKFGKLLDKRLSGKKPSKRRYKVRFAKAHTVKARTLPPRPMVPSAGGGLPARWEKPISDAVARGIEWWAEKATK